MAFKSITGLRDVDNFRQSDMDDVADVYLVLDSTGSEGVDFWSQEFQLSGAGDRVNWVAGLYLSQEEPFSRVATRDPRALGAFGAIINSNDTLQETDHMGIYVQGTFNFTQRLALTAGVRYSEDDKTFQTGRISTWDAELVALASQLGLAPITVPPTPRLQSHPDGLLCKRPDGQRRSEVRFNDASVGPRVSVDRRPHVVRVCERGFQGRGHE